MNASDDSTDTSEEGHQVSDVSDETDDPEREPVESGDFGLYNPIESGPDDANSGFETKKLDARKRRAPTRAGVPLSDHFITAACDETYHKLGKINSAEGESHLPAGGSHSCTYFFPAQDNIVCHSPSYGYGLLSAGTARAANTLGHDGSPGRQRWNDGIHP